MKTKQNRVKYKIGAVQQLKAIELNLDLKDAHILTYIRDLSTVKTVNKIVDGKKFFWLDYEKISIYIPLLEINNLKVMGRRMKKYEDLGLLKRHIHTTFDKTAGHFTGSYTFICLTNKFIELFEEIKISSNDLEIEKMEKEMGLSTEDTSECKLNLPQELKSNLIQVTDECLDIQGTQECLVNSLLLPINNTPIKNDGIFTEEEDIEINLSLDKIKKNIHVSRALTKNGKTTDDFINQTLKPAINKYSFKLAITALKSLYNCADREIISLSGIYYSKLTELNKI